MDKVDLRIVLTRDANNAATAIKDKFSGRPFSLSVDTVVLEPNHSKRNSDSRKLKTAKTSVLLVSPGMLNFLKANNIDAFFPTPDRSLALYLWVEEKNEEWDVALRTGIKRFDDWKRKGVASDYDFRRALVKILTMFEEDDLITLPERKDFTLLPSQIRALEDPVYIVFDSPPPGSPTEITVKFHDGRQTVASRHPNQVLFEFICPAFDTASVGVSLYNGEEYLGKDTLQIKPKMETLSEILNDVTNPMEFMCEALQIANVSHQDLDIEMTDIYGSSSHTKGGFFQDRGAIQADHREELPTILHLGARLGLFAFCSKLVEAPGANLALTTRNKDGLTPSQLAARYGHNKLHIMLKEKCFCPEDDTGEYMTMDTLNRAGLSSTSGASQSRVFFGADPELEIQRSNSVSEPPCIPVQLRNTRRRSKSSNASSGFEDFPGRNSFSFSPVSSFRQSSMMSVLITELENCPISDTITHF